MLVSYYKSLIIFSSFKNALYFTTKELILVRVRENLMVQLSHSTILIILTANLSFDAKKAFWIIDSLKRHQVVSF